MTKPITIRGTTYASRAEAARALGINRASVCNANREGRLDTVGLKASRPRSKPVTIRGTTYESQEDAAAAFGVQPGEIGFAVKYGVLDKLQPKHGSPAYEAQKDQTDD